MALTSVVGLAIPVPLRALASTNDRPRALALVDGGQAEPLFLFGSKIMGTHLPTLRVSRDLDLLLALEYHMRDEKSLRLIGLTDDATATLVIDLARSAGAQVPWLGEHSVYDGLSRHQLFVASKAESCAHEFSLHLPGDRTFCSVNEQSMRASERIATDEGYETSAQWAVNLGRLLPSLGSIPPLPAAKAVPANAPIFGNFVSFVIEA